MKDTIENINLDSYSRIFGSLVKDIRYKKGLTQDQLCDLSGVSRARISKLESGENFQIHTYIKVLKGLGQLDKLTDYKNIFLNENFTVK